MIILCLGLLAIKRKGIIPYVRQILIVILLFVINLRPLPIWTVKVSVAPLPLRCNTTPWKFWILSLLPSLIL